LQTSNERLRRTLTWYAFSLACTLSMAAGIVLVLQDHALTKDAILSSIGLNLVAGVLFAIIFTLLSARIQEHATTQSMEDQLEKLSKQLGSDLAQWNHDYLPSETYPALDPISGYGKKFNVDMMHSLEATDFYAFRGPSARYVAVRLRESQRIPQQVRVAMLSPGDHRAIARRASDRRLWARSKGKSPEQLTQEVHDELIMSVISLFDYRHICPVELLYTEDTAVFRFEMFDDAVYISWFHGPQSSGKEMPESMRFPLDSFYYKVMKLDFVRRFEISEHKITFDASQGDDFLIDHLADTVNIRLTAEDLFKWRSRHRDYVEDFVDYLREIPHSE
jgi:hypothetical protein